MALAKIKSASAALNLTMTPRHVTGMNQDISAVCYSGLDASHLASRTLFSKRKATRNQWETLKTWVWDRSLPVQKLPGNKNHKKKQGKFYNSAFSKSATPQKPSIQQSTILAAAHRSHHELTNQPELLKQPLPMMPKNHFLKKNMKSLINVSFFETAPPNDAVLSPWNDRISLQSFENALPSMPLRGPQKAWGKKTAAASVGKIQPCKCGYKMITDKNWGWTLDNTNEQSEFTSKYVYLIVEKWRSTKN